MGKVKVYQFIVLDPNEIHRRKSTRWGTRDAIAALKGHGEIIEGSAVLVDETELNKSGLTAQNFDPSRP